MNFGSSLSGPEVAGSAATASPTDAAPRSGRIAWIDMIRGLAIAGMVAFHLDWDLAYLGFVTTSPAASPAWMLFGNTVAAVFLCLSGVGVTLARPRGRVRALRRIGIIAGAALTVTLSTLWLFPQDAITFGILHCIAATNLVAVALRDAPTSLLFSAAVASIAAPLLLATGSFEGPGWWWLGLSHALPRTLDYRPVLPWLGPVLLGVGAARFLPQRGFGAARRWPAAALAFAGRHSLPIYLIHQPVLLGILIAIATVVPPSRSSFAGACEDQCVAAGAGRAGCKAACACAADRFGHRSAKDEPMALGPPQTQIDEAGHACVSSTTPGSDAQPGR